MSGSFKAQLKSTFGVGQGKPMTKREKQAAYHVQPSIANYLPWMEYSEDGRCFLLQDGLSVAAVYELEDVSTESSPESYLLELRDRFAALFQTTIPQEAMSPWHLQFFLQEERSLQTHVDSVESYIKPPAKGSQYTQDFLKTYQEHSELMTKPGGLFIDTKVTGNVFQGRVRKIRLVLYRNLTRATKLRRGQSVIQNLNQVAKKLEHQLKSADVKLKRYNGADFYDWMVRWFNPNPKQGQESVDELLKRSPYPKADEAPFGYDFVEQLFKATPKSDHKEGIWYFDDRPHTLLTVQSLNTIPKVGHITHERKQGKQRYGLFDRMPEGAVFVMTVVIEHQSDTVRAITKVLKSCVGNNTESDFARQDCTAALYQIEQGNFLFPTAMGVYVTGNDLEHLDDAINQVETLLTNNGFNLINPEVELAPCDAYLRLLPMAFDYKFDKSKGIRRSSYVYSRQLANLLPLYGRYRGTGNPCFLRFNRLGEPFCFDPFSKRDKSANSHMLYLAETGAGKSASLVWDLKAIMAIYNPRVFILEAGDSFRLFCEDAKALGKTVNQVKLSTKSPTPLNPFADALTLMKSTTQPSLDKTDAEIEQARQATFNHDSAIEIEAQPQDALNNDEERDILGEMAIAAELMITGGDPEEIKKFTRANRTVVLQAINRATETVFNRQSEEVITEDVVVALNDIATELRGEEGNSDKVIRIQEMADSMMNFTEDTFTASFFNRKGKSWPDVDITRLDMGLMKNKDYAAQLALAVMGILGRIATMAEATQYQNRMTLVLIDESHILTKNPLTATSVTQFSKMSRKLGMWLWLATQNMADFPDEAAKMLSMIEFWVGLGTSEAEIDAMARFKQISEEEKALFLSVHKDIPNYVEGVVMSRKVNGLFRNVPPRIALALGMTEKDEKTERKALMKAHNCSELDAAKRMAHDMVETIKTQTLEESL